MPAFEVTGPDGKKYRVDTPEGASANDAINYVNQQYYQQPQEQPVTEQPVQQPQPLPADDTSSDFIRGIKSYIPQQKELLGGAQVLTGKAFGSADMIKSGLERMDRAQKEQIPLSKETDSFTAALNKGLGAVITDYIPYIAGQGVGMVSEAVLSGVVGSILGSVAGPSGTVSGGVSGVVAKNLIKKGVKEQTEKIAKEFGQEAADNFVKKEIGDQLADKTINNQLRKEVNKEVGRRLGYTQLAARYGAGETTTRAVDEAIAGIEDPQQKIEKIQELSTSKLAAISTAHALADYIGVKIGLGALEGLAGPTRSMLLNIARKIGITGLQEAPVEVVQSALERYGADLPIADKQAMQEYVDAAAGGFFMPIIPATIGGIRTPKPTKQLTEEETKDIIDTEIEEEKPKSVNKLAETIERRRDKKLKNEEITASESANDILDAEEAINEPITTQQEDIQAQQDVIDSQQQIVQQEQDAESGQLDMFPPQMDLFEGEEDAGIDGRTNLRGDELSGEPKPKTIKRTTTDEPSSVASSGGAFDTASGRTITNDTTLERKDVKDFTDEELRKAAKLFVNNTDNLSVISREQAKRRQANEQAKIKNALINRKIDQVANQSQEIITRRTEYDEFGQPIQFESSDPDANLKVTDGIITKATPNSVFDSNLKPKVTKYQTDNNLQETHIIKENVDTEGNVESFSLVPRDTLDNTSVDSVAKYFANNYVNTKEAWNKREDAKPKPSEVRSFLEKNLSKEQFQEINKRKEYSTIADAAYKLMYKKTSGIAGIREERKKREQRYDDIAQEQGGMQPMNALMTETFEKTGAIEEDVPAPYERTSDFAEQRAEALKDWAFEAANDEYDLKDKKAIDKQIQKLAKERGYEEGEFSINDPLEVMTQDEYNTIVNEAPNVKDKTALDKFNDKKKVRDEFAKTFNAREKAVADRMKNTYDGMARIIAKTNAQDKVIGQKTLNERKLNAQTKRLNKAKEAARQENRGRKMDKAPQLSPIQLQALENKRTKTLNEKIIDAIKSGKTVQQVLNTVSGTEAQKDYRFQQVAKLLARVVGKIKGYNTKVKLGVVKGDRFAYFDPKTNTIIVNKNSSLFTSANAREVEVALGRIMVHEVMHSLMDHVIDNRNVLPQNLRKELDTLENLYKKVRRKLGVDTLELFQIDTFKEFVAEMFANEEVQNLVGTIDRAKSDRGVSSVLKDIARFISDMIKHFAGVTPGLTAQATLQSIENIITSKEYVPASETLRGVEISFAPKKAPKYAERSSEEIEKDLEDSAKAYQYKTWFGRSYATFKDIFTGGDKSIANLIRRFQNDRFDIKKLQDDAQKAGVLVRGGKFFNNIFDQITASLGRADILLKTYIKGPIEDFTKAFSSYMDMMGIKESKAIARLQKFLTALHESERRLVKYLKYVPLSTVQNIKLTSGKTVSAAKLREDIFNVLTTKTNLTDAEIQTLRARLEALVAKYKDSNGQSFEKAKYKSIDMFDVEYDVTALSHGQAEAIRDEYNNLPAKEKEAIEKIRTSMKEIQKESIELNRMSNYLPQQGLNVIKFYGWENYIPLKGKMESKGEFNETLNLYGKRLSGDLKRLENTFEGSQQDAQDPFAQVLVDATVAGARAGRRKLTQAIKNAVLTQVDYVDSKGVRKPTKLLPGGILATYTYKERYDGTINEEELNRKKNTILHYNEDGSIDVIEIKDMPLLEAIRRTYREAHPLLDIANGITGALGQLHTRFNPAFPVLNFVRDAITNAYNIAADVGVKESFEYLSLIAEQVTKGGLKDTSKIAYLYVNNNMEAINKFIKDEAKKGNTYPQDVLEYLNEGGNIAYVQGLSVAGTMNNLGRELNKNKILEKTEDITTFFDGLMLTFELASRIAAYRTAKQDFMVQNKDKYGKKQLEEAAREYATVYAKRMANFEETGEYGRAMGAWFMFFRPAATGAVRALESIGPALRSWDNVSSQLPEYIKNDPQKLANYEANFKRQQKAARTVIAASLGMGASVYLLAAALSGDDDDNKNKTFGDDMRRWTRFARFAIPGTDIVIQIPWGFGNGGLAAFGAQMAGMFTAKENPPREIFGNMIEIFMDSYLPLPISRINPLESSDHATAFVLDSFVPSAVRPLYEYSMNMNAFGQQIYNSRQTRVGDAYTGGDNIPDFYKDASIMLLNATDGAIDWSPNVMFFFANNYADGLTRMIQNGYGLGLTLAGNKDFDFKRDLQVFDSFVSKYSKADQRAYSRIRNLVGEKEKRLNALSQNPVAYSRYTQDNPYDPYIVQRFKEVEAKQINPARAQTNELRRMPGLTPKERTELVDQGKSVVDAYTKGLVAEIEVILEMAED